MSYIDYRQFAQGQAPQNFSYALNMLLEQLMRDDRITQSEMTVCLALAKCCHRGDGQCFPKVKTVMITAKVSERTFRSCLNSLEEKGYIIRNRRHRADGGQSSNVYTIPKMMVATKITQSTTSADAQEQGRSAGSTKSPTRRDGTVSYSADVADTPCNDCTPNNKDTLKKESSLSLQAVSNEAGDKQEKRDGFSILQRKAGYIQSEPHSDQRIHKAPEPQQALSGQGRVGLPSRDEIQKKRYLVDPSLLGIGYRTESSGDVLGLPVEASPTADRQRELCGADG